MNWKELGSKQYWFNPGMSLEAQGKNLEKRTWDGRRPG